PNSHMGREGNFSFTSPFFWGQASKISVIHVMDQALSRKQDSKLNSCSIDKRRTRFAAKLLKFCKLDPDC
ncbi:MAG: hypothetical protein OEV50_06890, partial [Candidatus Aminicenantes bacterium]|nr:hypothetical protein [Candidatus Aminicenantes bacterium]